MKTLLKLEEVALFLLAIVLFFWLDFNWWWFPLLLFAPDISMVGYIFNPKIGSIIYNLGHHQGIAILLFLVGVWLELPVLALAGCIILAHSALDRFLGYGLKLPDSFKNTHLGKIG